MAILDNLRSASTLVDIEALVQSPAWSDHLKSLTSRPPDDPEIEALRRAVADARTRLSPEHDHPELVELKARVYQGDRDPLELRRMLARIAALRAELPVREHERLFGRMENDIGQRFSAGLTGSGYSNRARRATDLFTEFAGMTRIEGASTDKHGNAEGTGYDLGRDGAFEGHTVHVLHLYTEGGFDFEKPTLAFERKGFKVERRTKPGTPESLESWLGEAAQLWLISSSGRVLSDTHLDVIMAFWQRGGALYIWGDNDPYFADANALLAKMFAKDLALEGNLPGDRIVHEIDPAGKGFLPHLVTTGLVHLYEGITVSSVDIHKAEEHDFKPMLYGSAGNLITVVREPTPAAGAVMLDGGFTRLYCKWDDAGTARYVCNSACFLAAMTLPAAAEEPPAEQPIDTGLAYDPEGAFVGMCDLTGEPAKNWLVLSVAEVGDALRNTTDMVLTDPLSCGAWNKIFSDAVYREDLAGWIKDNGKDPLTERPVAGCLPLVDLASKKNLREFTRELCRCLMGGKYLPTAARLLFFAVIDQMIDGRKPANRDDAWGYLYRQALSHFTSTESFDELGKPLPLLDAMTAFFSPATEDKVLLRRGFAALGVIGRTLLREGRGSRERVAQIARRSLLKSLVGDAVAAEKATPGAARGALNEMLYETFHGLPVLDGGRVVSAWPSFARDYREERAKLERALGGQSLLSPDDVTATLHPLLSMDLRQFTADSAGERARELSPLARAVWDGDSPVNVVGSLNQRFAAWHEPMDLTDVHIAVVVPFATTFGPSVYTCVCGERFGEPSAPLTPETLAALRTARDGHFKQVYRVEHPNWYPTDGSLHCNLHRAVQRVMASQFPDATGFEEAMAPAVAAYLVGDGKGFLCDPGLPAAIVTALTSYLALRAAGEPHPEGLMTFDRKAEIEREKLLRGA